MVEYLLKVCVKLNSSLIIRHLNKIKKEKLICIICNVSPDEGIHVSGIKFIKGTKEPYNICKPCCLGERNK